ncbi:MAG: RagB/SusD family nutrient uptake outer membrane protein [Muribaculaceae bacterium]|nr:RagB/SusD family nutrient uptake outer membrane protein [Muribaculaceae bacterium]MDE6810270.1 RagB/SusD family nutrient uptake outer membrane protein [Muribaculaceae bacterium]
MKLKKYILGAVAGTALAMTGVSCSGFTEIDPKGMNLLETVDQLEMLLNYEYNFSATDMMEISGDIIYAYSNLNTLMNQPVKSKSQILITWDEQAHNELLPGLTAGDDWYTDCYAIIGKVANPILMKIDDASGNEALKQQVKAEALTLRAYFHYLVIQKFGKAYNPSTADSQQALVYVTEDMDIKVPGEPSTMKEFYDHIIADLDAAIALNALPVMNVNRMRMSAPCPHAIKALACMAMQDYATAAAEANKALGMINTVVDYNTMTTTVYGYIVGEPHTVLYRPKQECPEDYFNVDFIEFYETVTPYGVEMFENGHAVKDKFYTLQVAYDFLPGMGFASQLIGEGYDWPLTYDLSSSWNNIGLKTTQMYLILAETAIANGKYDEAMEALDIIRVKRIDPELYEPLKGKVNDKATAIHHLRQTAHGENIYTVFNFIDRKRWTQLPDYKQTLHRTFGTNSMTLTPESTLWVFPIPVNVMSVNPNLEQNF